MNWQTVKRIRNLNADGFSREELSIMYGLSRYTIGFITKGIKQHG